MTNGHRYLARSCPWYCVQGAPIVIRSGFFDFWQVLIFAPGGIRTHFVQVARLAPI
jgi:hypothetical protein